MTDPQRGAATRRLTHILASLRMVRALCGSVTTAESIGSAIADIGELLMTMTRSITKGVITLAELQQSPEYVACSDKMKFWLVTLIENGFDYTAATAVAFTCKYPRCSRMRSETGRRFALR